MPTAADHARRHRLVDAIERHALPDAEPQARTATRDRACGAASPAITASASAQSATLLAIGPIESSVNDSGNAPSVGTRCLLGFQPTMPQSAAGMRVEPPVSVPIAISHMPSADRDRAARGRAARHARAVERIARRAVMRIGADAGEGEFAHVGLGDDHRAGRAQPLHHRRVGRGEQPFVGQHARARPRHFAGDVEQVLDADDRAVERTERLAGLGPRIGGIGRGARGLGIDRETGALALAGRIGDARQGLFETVAGGCFAHGHLVTSKDAGEADDGRKSRSGREARRLSRDHAQPPATAERLQRADAEGAGRSRRGHRERRKLPGAAAHRHRPRVLVRSGPERTRSMPRAR